MRSPDIVVISDVHLGTYGCHAKELLRYLRSIQPSTLVINGDFIDMWNFRRRYFPTAHIQVIQRIIELAASGTRVYYLTGNHDDALRRFSGTSIGNIHLCDKLVLQVNNQRIWIFHGDVFDVFMRYSPLVAQLGSVGYEWLIRFNRFVNKWRQRFGKPRMSFASKVKMRVKEAVRFVHDFERTAIELAQRKGYQYVICGHVHIPQIRTFGDVCYLNAGDWVENLTALEYQFGRWKLYHYHEMDFGVKNPRLDVDHDSSSSSSPEGESELFDELAMRRNGTIKRKSS
ncbi:MAG: UDP-2,3-diacylglucosamine hydrolase [Saprospiraceae bacterium]|nr:MAG: UDP-2,3-diacylglucosamine hydrolase [Saprospiraceae bacterium]